MLITFEGPDGSGKTTQLTLLTEFLAQQGYSLIHVREPGGTRIGEQIRDVLHAIDNQEMRPRAEVLLYSAARAQLVEEVIRPALAEGRIVLCDRFYDSTFAYQGYGHGLDPDALRQLTAFATGGLKPDLTLYIDIAPEEGLKRRQRNSGIARPPSGADCVVLTMARSARPRSNAVITWASPCGMRCTLTSG